MNWKRINAPEEIVTKIDDIRGDKPRHAIISQLLGNGNVGSVL